MKKIINVILLCSLWMPSAIPQTDLSSELLFGNWYLNQNYDSTKVDTLLFVRNASQSLANFGNIKVDYELTWDFRIDSVVHVSEDFANGLQSHRSYDWRLNEEDSVLTSDDSEKYLVEELNQDTLLLIRIQQNAFSCSTLENYILTNLLKTYGVGTFGFITSIPDYQVIQLIQKGNSKFPASWCVSSVWDFTIKNGEGVLTITSSQDSNIVFDGFYGQYNWKLENENVLSVYNEDTVINYRATLTQNGVSLIKHDSASTIPSQLKKEWVSCSSPFSEEENEIIVLEKSDKKLSCSSFLIWEFEEDMKFGLAWEGPVLSGAYVRLEWNYFEEENLLRIIDTEGETYGFKIITMTQDKVLVKKVD